MKLRYLLTAAILALPFSALSNQTNTNMVSKDYSDSVKAADDALNMFGNPEVQTVGDITFITGGIGVKETTFMKKVQKDYKLRVISSGQKGAYTGKATLVLKNSKGEELLATEVGPLFYANLPKGTYSIELTNEGTTQKKSVKFTGKSQEVRFVFKK